MSETIVIWADGNEPDNAMNKGVNVYDSKDDALAWMNKRGDGSMSYIVYSGCNREQIEPVEVVTTFRFKRRGM